MRDRAFQQQNLVDVLEAASDLTCKRELERMHKVISKMHDEMEKVPPEHFGIYPAAKEGQLYGLRLAMLELDSRIGELRDRWE